MESASHVSEYSASLGLFIKINGKCKPCIYALFFIGSVPEKKWKEHAMCENALFDWVFS